MSERTDHAVRARRTAESVLKATSSESFHASLAHAQVDALIAIGEQQRIANLIALAACAANPDVHGALSEAAHSVLDALIVAVQDSLDDEHIEITDDIKAALGIEVAR